MLQGEQKCLWARNCGQMCFNHQMVDQLELFKRQCVTNDVSLADYLNTDSTIDLKKVADVEEEILDEQEQFVKNKLTSGLNADDDDSD